MADSKLNLDLIQMVQRARMIHDSSAKPSEIGGVYWIEAKPREATQAPTGHTGQWLIPTRLDELDIVWERIRQATEAGQLGYKAKVATIASPGQANSQMRTILVYTYNADDTVDVNRVRQTLLMLGITAELQFQRQ